MTHEFAHKKNADPLKMLILQSFATLFFFIPLLKDIQKYFFIAKEVEADAYVRKVMGSTKSVQDALVKLLTTTSTLPTTVASFVDFSAIEERILILSGKKSKINYKFPLRNTLVSMLFLAIIFLVNQMPVYAVETPQSTHEYYYCSDSNNQNNRSDSTNHESFTPIFYTTAN